MSKASQGVVYTMGIGAMEREQMVRRLMARQVEFVVETRSPPFALHRAEFEPAVFKGFLQAQQIKYLDLSAALGDRPRDISLRTTGGRLDYRRYLKRDYAKQGLSRIALAHITGCRVCVIGREDDPAWAHHARLVGEGLGERGVLALHVRRDGDATLTHTALRRQITRSGDSIHLSPL